MSNDHLIDTKIKLGICNRCSQYVFMAMSSGARAAADPAPATREAYIAALMDGRRVFRLLTAAGRPHKLLSPRVRDLAPEFDAGGAQTGAQGFLVEHGCGGRQRNMLTFEEVEQVTTTVCDTWKAQGWTPPPGRCARERNPSVTSCPECDAPPFDLAGMGLGRPESVPRDSSPADQPQRPSDFFPYSEKRHAWTSPTEPAARPGREQAVPTAPDATRPSVPTGLPASTASAPSASTGVAPTPPPSGLSSGAESGAAHLQTVRCHICEKIIDQSVPHFGIHHGRWVWAIHEECE